MLKWTIVFLWVAVLFPARAQDLRQQVSGIVRDAANSRPLIAAAIEIKSGDQTIAAMATDSLGVFRLEVEPGRYLIHVSHLGYQARVEELLVISGKESRWSFDLHEQVVQLDEVRVQSAPSYNPAPGAVDISIEKTLRVPANFFDPLRMASSMPGMATVNDQGNALAIKGYSPNSIVWKVQGMDVVNPNHLANAGTLSDRPVSFGGGVSILSSQVLDKTGFYAGWMPARYGNALSGVVDMSLREGNKRKREYTAQASLIGIDLAAEGPIGSNSKNSYLVNYRYSTVGLLSSLGLNFGDEKINFQDITFHLDMAQSQSAHLSVFGFGGLSSNRFTRKSEAEWKEEKDRYNINFDGNTFGLGFRENWGRTFKWTVGGTLSGQQQNRSSQSQPVPFQHVSSEKYNADQLLFSGIVSVQRPLDNHLLEAGIQTNYLRDQLKVSTQTPLYLNTFFPNVDGAVSGLFYQPYMSWQAVWGAGIVTQAAVRYSQFTFNNTGSLDPRFSIRKDFRTSSITASFNATSQKQQTQTYLATNNHQLELSRANQWLLEYRHYLSPRSKFIVAAYYHFLQHIPTTASGPIYSAINQWEEFAPTDLVSQGKGQNRGVELSFDKSFDNRFYFALNGSVYRATFSSPSSGELMSRFNGRFTSSTMIGKEWGTAGHAFGIHARFIYVGGMRQPSVDLFGSVTYGTTVYANYQYTVQMPDYWRPDVRVSWRKNKHNYTRTFSIDIQNIANRQNVAYYYYDTFTRDVEVKRQLGIIPVLVYRVDF